MKRDRLAHLRLPPIKRRERPFEARLRDRLKVYGVLFVKNKPTIVGWPDRTAVGFGEVGLVELKRDFEGLDEAQEILHGQILRDHGVRVLLVQSGFGLESCALAVVGFLKDLSLGDAEITGA
ncbi:MAG TPA: hypothetical protein VMH41_16110 [Mycobacteriales bacterium]|nr:hypothetical protein [Mycobacteriales bacterium]